MFPRMRVGLNDGCWNATHLRFRRMSGDREYTTRLEQETGKRWKRLLGVQTPYRLHIRRVIEGRVLDIGCGIGRNLQHLDGRGVGVDVNPYSIEVARKQGFKAYTVQEFESSPDAAPESYDSLLIAHVLEHMTPAEASDLLAAYLPYLRSGGRVVIIVPQEAGFRFDATHVTFLDLGDLAGFEEANGLSRNVATRSPSPDSSAGSSPTTRRWLYPASNEALTAPLSVSASPLSSRCASPPSRPSNLAARRHCGLAGIRLVARLVSRIRLQRHHRPVHPGGERCVFQPSPGHPHPLSECPQPGWGSARSGHALPVACPRSVLLAYAAHWLVKAGVPVWLAVGVAWLLGLSPAIGPTTLALWKDIPFALLMLWAWVELLALAVDPDRADRVWPAVRLGLALAGVWLFRGNGPITVLPVLAVLAWVYRRHLRLIGITLGTAVLTVFLIVGPLYAIVDVQGSAIEPAQVFLPDLAAAYNDEPGTFTKTDVALLEAVAPLSIWDDRYDCYDSTPLLFDPEFNQGPIRQSPGKYLDLEVDVLFRDFDSVLEHRVCAANFLYAPAQPKDAYFHRPPYDIPTNTVGLARDPLATWAFKVTDRVWRWAEIDSRLWLTWRPAILLLPALAAVVVFAFRDRRFLLPSTVLVVHTINVIATSPAQEFRYAYPLYLMAALTLTLIWPAFRGGGELAKEP